MRGDRTPVTYVSIRRNPTAVVLVTGVTLLITLRKGKWKGGKSTMGIRNFNLRVSQITKRRKIRLTAGFSFISAFTPPKQSFRIYL
jgi:hypothetical protein